MSTNGSALHGSNNSVSVQNPLLGRVAWVGNDVLVNALPVDVGPDEYKRFIQQCELSAIACN